MRIVNNRYILAFLFNKKIMHSFSNIRKKHNRNLQLKLVKQEHEQNTDNSIIGKLPNEIWQLPQNKKEKYEENDNSSGSLGLKYLEEAFNFGIASNQIMKKFYESGSISQQTKKKNSQAFLRLISHSLSRETCLQIIHLIQAHCALTKGQSEQKIGLINSSSKSYQSLRKSQKILFKKLQDIMLEEMLLDESAKQDNDQYVNHLLNILAESDKSAISHQFFGENNLAQEPEEVQPIEIRSFLNSQYFNQAQRLEQIVELPYLRKNQNKDNQSENKLDQALKIRQNQKTKIHVKTKKTSTHREIKIKVAPQQDIFFTKVAIKQDPELNFKLKQSQKYAYIYDLPFFTTNNECKDLVEYLQRTRQVKITSYRLFSYGSYFQLVTKQKKFHIPQFYQAQSSMQKIYQEIDLDMYFNTQKNNKKGKNKYKEQPSGLSWTTQALLKKIRKQKYSMFNRTVLVAKFQSQQQKKKLINPDTRLYGLTYKNMKNIKFQQGFSKTVVRVHGIPPGCTTTQLNQFLNKVFQSIGYNFQVQTDLYLSKNYILIQFQHFVEVLKAINLLQNRIFKEKQLKAEIIYGSSKLFKGNFTINFNDTRQKLKQRVTEVAEKYYKINEDKKK